jgi:hypothetical protein
MKEKNVGDERKSKTVFYFYDTGPRNPTAINPGNTFEEALFKGERSFLCYALTSAAEPECPQTFRLCFLIRHWEYTRRCG